MSNQLANIKNETLTRVESQIQDLQKTGGLHFPPNYSPQNALKAAWLVLQETKDRNGKAALEVCSKESICMSLLDMTIQGLSVAKKQGYFIVYGTKLQFSRSYFGTMAVAKRSERVKDIFAQVVFEGDEFEFEINRAAKRITKHTQKLENINIDKIIAAYCTIIYDDGQEFSEIMTIGQIRTAWTRGATKGNSSAHKDQPEEMAKRTVINRTCKAFINTMDDSDLLMESFDRSEEKSVDDVIEQEIEENANSELIDIQYEVDSDIEPETFPTVAMEVTTEKKSTPF